jgi:hypothetical protein
MIVSVKKLCKILILSIKITKICFTRTKTALTLKLSGRVVSPISVYPQFEVQGDELFLGVCPQTFDRYIDMTRTSIRLVDKRPNRPHIPVPQIVDVSRFSPCDVTNQGKQKLIENPSNKTSTFLR